MPPVGLLLGLAGVRVHRAAPQSTRTNAAVIGPTKTHPTRTALVPSAVIGHVIARRAKAGPGDWLFPTSGGRIWTNTNFRYRAMWTKATRAVGLGDRSIHDLRHTAASLLIAVGADVKAVQVILGHATATMTMDLYRHLSSDAPWRARPGMPELVDPKLPTGSRAAPSAGRG